MGLADPDAPATRAHIDRHTLVRRIELWDPDAVLMHCSTSLAPRDGEPPLRFELNERQLPDDIPAHWTVVTSRGRTVQVTVHGELAAMLPHTRTSRVSSAGQLPTGFSPGDLYPSRSHPRSGSAMGQLDNDGYGGLFQNPRASSAASRSF